MSDDEWAFVASNMTLMSEDAPQRFHSLREVFNGLGWIVRAGAPWRMLPNDLPPWEMVYQQTLRWIRAGEFAAMLHDLRSLLRHAQERKEQLTAAIFDSRNLQSSPESSGWAGYDGHKCKPGSKTHIAVDTLVHLLALYGTPAHEQDRVQVKKLAEQVQDATGQTVEVRFVDQGYTGEQPAQYAQAHGAQLEVIELPKAKKGVVLLPRRWILKHSFARATRFRRLARDYERLPETLAGLDFLAFAILMLMNFVSVMANIL